MPDTTPPTLPASPIQRYLDALHARFAPLQDGAVATYIPELAKADPAWFGIAIATVDGQVYEAGDARQRFTIQSVSKPLVHGIALEDVGREAVERHIGVEPTGDAFNSISLEPGTGRPLNPLINAGAIAAASLVQGASAADRLERVLGAISAYAGRRLEIDHAVFESERATGHRNRAIGHMLRNAEIIRDDPEPALELYFQQCSILVDCRDLALIAATLANGGVQPVTGERAVAGEHVGAILSVMTTCGMYDSTGEWVYRIGMPAKSGVGGGIIAVLPGQLGIGVFSPALDVRGNSVRGVKACEAISRELGLHFLQPPRPSASTVRARYTLAGVRSKRRRPEAERLLLDELGHRAVVHELQGDLRFATVEPLLREIGAAGDAVQIAVLDFKRVHHVDAAAAWLLARLVDGFAESGRRLVLTRVRRGDMLKGLDAEIDPRHVRALVFQPQLDLGLEWCERELLKTRAAAIAPPAAGVSLAEHRLCAGMDAAGLAALEALTARRGFDAGATIVARGDPADALYFLVRGEVSVVVELPQGGLKRLSTLSAGMGFGETALTAGGLRTANVRADTEVECRVLAAADFARLEQELPALAIRLLHNLLKAGTETAARLTAEVAALEG